MNQKEVKLASSLTKDLRDKLYCPACNNHLEEVSMVKFQSRCASCLLRITIFVDEGASRIFDKQRQVEKPVAAPLPEGKDLRWTKDIERKKQKSKRKPQRTQKQKASRKLGMQSLKERRKSRGV